jgi:Flp pilus assembly protein TadB
MGDPALLTLAIVAFAALAAAFFFLRRRRVLSRLAVGSEDEGELEEEVPPNARVAFRERPFVPWIVGVGTGFVLHYATGLTPAYIVSFALMAGVFTALILSSLLARKIALLEGQLADALDLIVSTLRAGASVSEALSEGAREAKAPLRPQLEEVLARLRFGEDPQDVFRDLAERVPLETYELFAMTLAVHWETGGSLADTLGTVSRTIRDRVEVARQVRYESTQARVSIVVIFFAVYGIALISWRMNPERMEAFLATDIGSSMAAGAVLLQGLGLLWLFRMSKIEL